MFPYDNFAALDDNHDSSMSHAPTDLQVMIMREETQS